MTGKNEYLLDRPPVSESEALFRGLFENSSDAIQILDNFTFVECNQATVEILHAKNKEEVLSTHPSQLSPEFQPDGRPSGEKADEMIRLALEKGGHRFEWMHRRVDGEDFPVEVMLTPVTIGDKTMLYSSWRDIADRKAAEARVQETQRLLEGFLDNFPDGAWVKDLDGRFLLANRYVSEEIAGQAVIGKTVYDTMPKENADFVWATEKQLLETGESISVEEDVPHADGKVYQKITTKFPLYDTEGNISGIGGILIDITERMQAEQAFAESQRLLQLVMDNIPQAVFWKDQSLVYLGANQAFTEDAGFDDPQELIGKTDFDMPWTEQAEIYRADDQQVMDKGEPKLNYEEPQTGSTGEITWLRTSKVPIKDDEGNVLAVLGMYEDITERKRLEQQVQETLERRGYQVQISTEISQEISKASELEDLFNRVVTLTKERLGYYHVQLLRYDPSQDAVVLITGYGEIGRQMLAQGHRMALGSGLIGTAAALGETVIRSDLTDDPFWKPNPLLPETHGEIAVPIKLGDEILGVLDIQSDVAGALTDDDRLLLEGLCGQIAIAIDQTRLRQEMDERIGELNTLYRSMSREGWQEFRATGQLPKGFVYDQATIQPVDETSLAEGLFANIPLTLPGGELLGELGIADDPDHPLSDEDKAFLEQISEQVALALESARLFEQTQSALDTIQESEAQLAEALRVARLGYWEYSLTEDLFTFNDQFYAIFHNTAEEVGGYRLSSAEYAQHFVHPDDAPLVGAEIERALATTDRYFSSSLEHRILYADGGMGYISVTINLERDENGEITRWYGANQDITERKVAEETLREVSELQTAILEGAEYALISTTPEGTITAFNPGAERMLGYTAEELIGKSDPGAFHDLNEVIERAKIFSEELGYEIEPGFEVFVARSRQNLPNEYEWTYIRKDGTRFPVLLAVSALRDDRGEITGFLGIANDITERKAAEDAVREAQERAQTILETVTIPMVITRLADNILTFANQPAADLIGITIDEMVNQPSPNFYYNPEERQIFIKELQTNGSVSNMQMQLMKQSGEPFWALISARVFNYQGVTSILSTVLDITDRIQAQEAVAKRAAELATVAQVGTAISTILEPNAMLQTVVDLTKERFDLYHAHIYLMADDQDALRLVAGAGSVGTKMVAEGWQIPLDAEQSLVAQAAREHRGIIVNNVQREVGFMANPLLPDTASELAVPLLIGDQVLGVLDVQSDEVDYFSEEDVNIQTTLAAQISVALQNAQTYASTQRQAEHEALVNLISQRIQSTTSVENALQVAIRELGRALGAKRTSVQLGVTPKTK